MDTFTPDRESTQTLCGQLYGYLKGRIDDGTFAPGTYLPSENDMISKYGLSRITVRNAVSDLETAGYVRKQRGKGSLVLERARSMSVNGLKSLHELYAASGQDVQTVILNSAVVEPKAFVSEVLALAPGEKIFVLKRLLVVEGQVVGVTTVHIPYREELASVYEDPANIDSVYGRLREAGVVLDHAEETITVRRASEDTRQTLFLAPGSLVVHTDNVTFDDQGRPVEYTAGNVQPDKFSYTVSKSL